MRQPRHTPQVPKPTVSMKASGRGGSGAVCLPPRSHTAAQQPTDRARGSSGQGVSSGAGSAGRRRPRRVPWNLRFLYVTLSTLNPIAAPVTGRHQARRRVSLALSSVAQPAAPPRTGNGRHDLANLRSAPITKHAHNGRAPFPFVSAQATPTPVHYVQAAQRSSNGPASCCRRRQ